MGALIVLWLLWGGIAAAIGARKGKMWMGLALGVTIGVFGVLVMLIVKPDREYTIQKEAEKLAVAREAQSRVTG